MFTIATTDQDGLQRGPVSYEDVPYYVHSAFVEPFCSAVVLIYGVPEADGLCYFSGWRIQDGKDTIEPPRTRVRAPIATMNL